MAKVVEKKITMASRHERVDKMENDSNQFSVVSSGHTSSVTASLFPVKSDTTINFASEHNGNLDWLESKSFLPTAVLLAEEKTSFHPQPSSSKQTSFARHSAGFCSEISSEKRSPQQTEKTLKRSMPLSEYDDEVIPAEKAVKMWKEEKEENQKWNKEKGKRCKKKKQKKKDVKGKTDKQPSSTRNSKARKDYAVDFSKSGKDMSKTFVEEIPGLQPEHAFTLDYTAEKSLWNYESVCKNKIAKHFCLTHHCLGNINISLHQQGEKDKGSLCRYFMKDYRKEIRTKGMFVTVDRYLGNDSVKYIPFSKGDKKNKPTGETNAPKGDTNGKQVTVADGNEQYVGLDETIEKTAYYNRQLHDDPSNVKLWLDFVDFQNQIFQDFSPEFAANKKLQDFHQSPLACIEKKLSILDKALKANPSSLELKIKRLEIQQDVTDSTTLVKEWDKLLVVNSADVKLWRHYLVFNQSQLASFTVGRITRLYHQCFSTLSAVLQGQVKDVKKADSLEEDVIGLFEQYCTFLLQTGFDEKAVSSYQALIEFNLFRPPSLNLTPTVDCVAAFESFWNSGIAKFGETGATGWAAWMKNPTIQDSQIPRHCRTDMEQEKILDQDRTLLHTWLGIEQLRQSTHWLSWRPNFSKGETEEDCEDLDRLILYEDVAPVLFSLSESASCSRLVMNFVHLLGLAQQQKELCYTSEFHQLQLASLHQVSAARGMNVGITVGSLWQPCAEIVQFLEEVLRQAAAFFTGWYQTYFISQLLQLQIHRHGILDVTSLTAKQSKEIRKFGKSLLKETQNRNDLLLWNKYIQLEWALGKNEDAMSMLQTALTMFTSNISSSDHGGMAGLCSLYRTSAEIVLNFRPTELVRLTSRKASPSSDSKNSVMNSFMHLMDTAKLPGGSSQSATAGQVLVTRRKFQSVLKKLIGNSAGLSDPFVKTHIVQCVICFALFEFCAAGLGESLKVFSSMLQLCSFAYQETNNPQTKKAIVHIEADLTESLLSFLTNCMSVEAIPLGQIKSHLDTGLVQFPDNPILLRYLVDLESKSCFARRLRHYFQAATQEPASVYPVLFEMLSEMSRYAKLMTDSTMLTHAQDENVGVGRFWDTGIIHRVRAACERALQHKVAQRCPLIWRLYLHFEASYGSTDKAEGILYRALQMCPWAKVLYLDGIELFDMKHFHELLDLMTEKELRIRIPLEEVELLILSEPQDAADDKQSEPQDAADDKQSELQDAADDKQSESQDAADDKQSELQDAADDKQSELQDAADDKQSELQDAADDKQSESQDAADDKQSELQDAADDKQSEPQDAADDKQSESQDTADDKQTDHCW